MALLVQLVTSHLACSQLLTSFYGPHLLILNSVMKMWYFCVDNACDITGCVCVRACVSVCERLCVCVCVRVCACACEVNFVIHCTAT